jgi:hypothetical protein
MRKASQHPHAWFIFCYLYRRKFYNEREHLKTAAERMYALLTERERNVLERVFGTRM